MTTKAKPAPSKAKKTPAPGRTGATLPAPAAVLVARPATETLADDERAVLLDSLTGLQRAFYNALPLHGYDATKAYRAAAKLDEPKASHRVTAHDLRHHPIVARLVADDFAGGAMTAAEAKARLATLARAADMTNFLRLDIDTVTGETVPRLDVAGALIDGHGSAIKEYEEVILNAGDEGERIIKRTIKLHDQMKALELVLRNTPEAEGGTPETGSKTIFFQQVNALIQGLAPDAAPALAVGGVATPAPRT